MILLERGFFKVFMRGSMDEEKKLCSDHGIALYSFDLSAERLGGAKVCRFIVWYCPRIDCRYYEHDPRGLKPHTGLYSVAKAYDPLMTHAVVLMHILQKKMVSHLTGDGK
ncbi:MAG: hypothetical protein A3I44_03815 [Candidatus Sungbacteria bacterium RIFCSPLOWO2_02_FULL_51_17]|uniref:Uncharacterized protein n=1 Tax=Candidatus Sungbacteria bacterium RIFCSPHIGHO2_02_FULL_51_29 TaxID=1802273 RepID=A0A1G2KSD3_9BACT|nr:MAG: hypothetical protein A2676_02335 [Candidatus Sungbacteria bacterium RIFCSPHIGHO2_01_FULL_51_22]OHA01482.1 MAG: hypothetical protein A3C16_05550 [Candidatus Sungbacteria bacterium RIFCSPHIGHO2_02_FULL_51_29]OHA06978.1 MAG: hypothetical protein A3B29_00255 [Candidatus Sungbacteria bacterium RIFCSPLOWO2_01_FULL_51_34]OHA11213.1 MAG: hypothetical protein A3I44_03815 [Candidatus Sungbacteria bacterium RIFCSPLOWO2_02_FULL_51_17]